MACVRLVLNEQCSAEELSPHYKDIRAFAEISHYCTRKVTFYRLWFAIRPFCQRMMQRYDS